MVWIVRKGTENKHAKFCNDHIKAKQNTTTQFKKGILELERKQIGSLQVKV